MKHASVDRAKRVDSQCRNNGACPYCRRSRTIRAARVEARGRNPWKDYQDSMARLGEVVDDLARNLGIKL